MKKIFAACIFVFSFSANAGGWTADATIERVEIVRDQGFMVFGTFGNPSECTATDALWIPISHTQYEQLYSTALSAFIGGKKLKAYAHTCSEIGWHGGSYNTLSNSGAMYIKS